MARIAALLTDLFQDSEFLHPTHAFRNAGHLINNIGLKSGKKVKGLESQTLVYIDSEVGMVKADDFDALFIPGGYSPDRLRENEEVLNLVREFMKTEKPVFVICHGLQLLISACMLAGRQVAGRKGLAQDIANAGGSLSDRKVVIDNNLISCCGDADLPVFILACLQKLSALTQ